MANIVEVRVACFIDDPWILFGTDAVSGRQTWFEGNSRGFTYFTENQLSLFKMAQHVVVNFGSQTVNVYNQVGPTRKKVTESNGTVVSLTAGSTNTNSMQYTTSINSSEANIWLRGASANPQVNLSPDIDWDYNVKVKSNGEVTVQGHHDGYPNHEIYKRIDGGSPVTILNFNKQTLASLFPPMEHSINKTV